MLILPSLGSQQVAIIINFYQQMIKKKRNYNKLIYRLEETGTKFIIKKLDSLKELYDDYDLIVNCSGLGARTLCQDRRMIPIRGQVAKVKN